MSFSVTMPALGESVSEGTVTRWLKNVGDSVAVDEALLEVSTDKVDTEIPSPVAGKLSSIDVSVDPTVAVGAGLATRLNGLALALCGGRGLVNSDCILWHILPLLHGSWYATRTGNRFCAYGLFACAFNCISWLGYLHRKH